MSGRLDGKIALVTGGSSGIGAAVVRLLRAEAATVVACSRSGGPDIERCDVTDEDAVAALVETVVERHGAVGRRVQQRRVDLAAWVDRRDVGR